MSEFLHRFVMVGKLNLYLTLSMGVYVGVIVNEATILSFG